MNLCHCVHEICTCRFSARVAPAIGNRMVESAKGLCYQFIPDVWLFTDHYTGKQSGNSPGYALYLQAETTTHCRLSVEVTGDQGMVPEDLAKQAAQLLFEEIKRVRMRDAVLCVCVRDTCM